jgi:hypothetical protein
MRHRSGVLAWLVVVLVLSAGCSSKTKTEDLDSTQTSASDAKRADDAQSDGTRTEGTSDAGNSIHHDEGGAGPNDPLGASAEALPDDPCSAATTRSSCEAATDRLDDGYCRWLDVDVVTSSGEECQIESTSPACIFFGGTQRGACGGPCLGGPAFVLRGSSSILLRNQSIGCDEPASDAWVECDHADTTGPCLCVCR